MHLEQILKNNNNIFEYINYLNNKNIRAIEQRFLFEFIF